PVLHALLGEVQLDVDLLALALLLPRDIGGGSSRASVERVIHALDVQDPFAPVELESDDMGRALGVAREANAQIGLGTVALPLLSLPRDPTALAHLKQA